MILSFIFISKVKAMSQALIANKRFKEYNTEAEIALGDILYLPQEFESDDNEDEFWILIPLLQNHLEDFRL